MFQGFHFFSCFVVFGGLVFFLETFEVKKPGSGLLCGFKNEKWCSNR